MIEFDNVTKVYRTWFGTNHAALNGVSFSVTKGAVVGFVGENGAGKSTAIKVLLGLSRPNSGRVLLRGLTPSDFNSRRKVGYVPEIPSLADNLTPREVISNSWCYRNGGRSAPGREIDQVVERLGLKNVENRRIRQLSKGLAQRTVIAQAIVGNPDVLILDEPLSGLDPSGRAEVVELLDEYKTRGGTIFFSSHVLYDVERLADQVLFIHRGMVHEKIDVQEFLRIASREYLVRYVANREPDGPMPNQPGVSTLAVDAEKLESHIHSIIQASGQVLEVKPSSTLERKFLEMIRQC